jgi:hypothetical protein
MPVLDTHSPVSFSIDAQRSFDEGLLLLHVQLKNT